MRRTVIGVLALLLVMLLAPYRAGALGLGDIKLSSYLNQPLKAEIGVLPAQAGELDDAKISLAPNDAFEKAGIERRAVLDQINFQLVKGADGTHRIEVTTQEPVKEPFLDFVLQITWPKGRLLREYTVLLDPPVTTGETAPPIQPAVSGAATIPSDASIQSSAPVSAADQVTTAAGAAAASAAVPTRSIEAKLTHDAYGPTQRTDTLWSIAKTVRPDGSVSVQQVMLALVKKNPDAFYNDNVNTLKAGYILRLPDLALINQVDEADAIRQVKRQYQQWQDMKAGKLPVGGSSSNKVTPDNRPGAGSHAGAAAQTNPDEQARLKLLPPDAGQTAAAGTGGATAADGKPTQDRLASALETSEAQKQENESLRSRINELNDQVASMQRLLALKDDTLAVLQNKLSETQQAGAPAVAPQTPAASAPQAPAAAVSQPAQAAKPAGTPRPTVVNPPVHTAPKAPPPHRGGLLSDPKILGVGGAVALLLGALGWLALRRRKMKVEALMQEEEAQQTATAAAEESDEKTVRTEEYSPTGGDLLEAEVNEIDPLSEADVYMAYRKYEHAEELLKGAIEQEPNRQELRLKLLEVYAAGENTDAFASEAENFYNEYGGRDNPLWQKVASMGREVQPGHPLFSADGEDEMDAVAQAGMETDTDTDTDVPEVDDSALFSMDVEPLAVDDDESEPAFGGDDGVQAPEPGLAEEELTFLEAEPMEESSDTPQVDETVAEVGDTAEADTASKDESLAIEFEPGLDKVLSDQDSASKGQDDAAPFKTGNEIDFDAMVASGDQSNAPVQPVEASSDEPLSDDLEDAVSLDTVDGLEEVEQAGEETGLDFLADDKDQDGLAAIADDADYAESDKAGEDNLVSADDQGGGKLDFDFELGSLATKDKDLDDFFEGLDSGDEAEDGSGGHEEIGTKLDLAKAFIEMGDQDGAKDILKEVVDHGDDDQKQEAQGLLQQLDA